MTPGIKRIPRPQESRSSGSTSQVSWTRRAPVFRRSRTTSLSSSAMTTSVGASLLARLFSSTQPSRPRRRRIWRVADGSELVGPRLCCPVRRTLRLSVCDVNDTHSHDRLQRKLGPLRVATFRTPTHETRRSDRTSRTWRTALRRRPRPLPIQPPFPSPPANPRPASRPLSKRRDVASTHTSRGCRRTTSSPRRTRSSPSS